MNTPEYLNDTIAAIATPVGQGAIGIVRVSGVDAIACVGSLFHALDKKELMACESHTISYGTIQDPLSQKMIDKVLVMLMRKPRTYTGENIVEINCHGGPVALKRVLDCVLAAGARLAEPGEFTRRAFMHGKCDLIQAEAVNDIVHAQTERTMECALEQLSGGLSQRIAVSREILVDIMARLESAIDFPEEDISHVLNDELASLLSQARQDISALYDTFSRGVLLREGVDAVICGRPNVGKSSLFNRLLGRDRAIITDIPGTTRDTLDDLADVHGIPLRLIDTAGITESKDIVEQEGIKRAHHAVTTAQIALLVVDASQPLSEADKDCLMRLQEKKYLIALNKDDLPCGLTEEDKKFLKQCGVPFIPTSAITGDGLEKLGTSMVELCGGVCDENVMITTMRQGECLRSSLGHIDAAMDAVAKQRSIEFIAADCRAACEALDILTGRVYSEDLLDTVFSRFCIGK